MLYLVYDPDPQFKMPHCIYFVTDDKAWAKEYCEYVETMFGSKLRIKTLRSKQLCLTKRLQDSLRKPKATNV